MFANFRTRTFSSLTLKNQKLSLANRKFIDIFKLFIILLLVAICFFAFMSSFGTIGKRLFKDKRFLRKIKWNCDFKDIGETEQLQLQQYFTMKRSNLTLVFNESVSPTLFSFQVHNVAVYCNNVHFIINETALHNNKSSVGGSSFLVSAISKHFLVTCSINDLFNGQYVVNCPLYDSCTNISAEVFYTNFGAFYEYNQVPSVIFLNLTICHPINSSTIDINDNVLSKRYVGWYRRKASDVWSWAQIMDTIRIVSTNYVSNCLHNITFPVYFYGDSHARYVFFYLLRQLKLLSPKIEHVKLKSKLDVKNFHYDFAASLTLFNNPLFPPFFPRANNLLTLLSNTSATGQPVGNGTTRHVFVLSAGTWDAARDSVGYLQDHVVPKLTDYIITLQKLAEKHHSKVIYLTSPASNRRISKKIDGRNIAKLAAFNKLVTNILRNNGVTIVDYFAMTENRYRESNSDGFHYSTSPNSVGENVAKEVLYEICQML